jgi:TnpA family transposase
MKHEWTDEELIEHWTLLPNEMEWLANKTGATRLGFAALLEYFQQEGCFPHSPHDVPATAIAYLARQAGVVAALWFQYDWDGRTIKYHRAQIRTHLGFREATVADAEADIAWLCAEVLPHEQRPEHLPEVLRQHLRARRIEPPTAERLDRIVRSALAQFEEQITRQVMVRLSAPTLQNLEALLNVGTGESEAEEKAADQKEAEIATSTLAHLKADPGRASLESVLTEITRLEQLRRLNLPPDLFRDVSPKLVLVWRRRVVAEELHELRRHPTPLRMTLLAAFCQVRQQEITDSLLELLMHIIHRIGMRAERRVEKQLIGELKRVAGKDNLLCRMAETALEYPEGIVREVLYPVVSEQTLRDLVREFKAQGNTYRQQVYTVMRASYSHHYRRMTPLLLQALEFRSNNEAHQPVMRALELIIRYAGRAQHYYDAKEEVPLDGVVKSLWRDEVAEQDGRGRVRIDRIKYEISVLQALRERLRCKEIWVVGANRYRNPDEDLPADFETQRETYYAALQQPLAAEEFVNRLKQEMAEELAALDQSLPTNALVRILTKGHGWISLSPLEARPEAVNLTHLKAELMQRWPMTSLLDILKETDLRTGFSASFKSPTGREHLVRSTLQKRLLLSLYGLGTNTGLKRVSAGDHGESNSDLLYVRRRFITRDQLRNAIVEVVNAIFQARLPHIWGEGTTACASDSKKFGAWDQNLMTEWHVRYGGRGVMIYWHVERHATCIYSQLKTCSSSEVAAMIEGLLRHETEAEIEKNYVDSHGQSEVAFAFCHLLGFQLLPRLKAIHAQKLYRPESGQADAYPNLQPVLTRPINWELIRQQYDQMIKYATALRLGTAETEAILRRFTRNNLKHPTYQALAELGKADKTIFLCRYLRIEALRREIQEGLNVIENWNGANDFIYYGKGGEMATNRLEDQELAMLSLHLLQICLVYINTLMMQQILSEPQWADRLTAEDQRALTPLVYTHVNPYGTFNLNLNERLLIEPALQKQDIMG